MTNQPWIWIGFSVFVLLMLETTDLVFAVDSVPAALAITTNPFGGPNSTLKAAPPS